jgi:hypothetical protein
LCSGCGGLLLRIHQSNARSSSPLHLFPLLSSFLSLFALQSLRLLNLLFLSHFLILLLLRISSHLIFCLFLFSLISQKKLLKNMKNK